MGMSRSWEEVQDAYQGRSMVYDKLIGYYPMNYNTRDKLYGSEKNYPIGILNNIEWLN